MNNKKKIIIILVIIAIIVVAVSLFLAFKDISARNLLTEEINQLSETNTNTDVKSTGKYAAVEKQVKEDCKAYYETIAKLRENYDKATELKVINIENYENDGPEFKNSLDSINAIKTENQELITTLTDLTNEEKLEERATNAGMSGKYKNLYKEILEEIKLADGVGSAKEKDTKFDGYLASLLDVLTYMRDNTNEWFIEKGTLKSHSQEFIDTYNQKVQNTNVEL